MGRPLRDDIYLDALAVSLRDMLARVNRMRAPTWSASVTAEREAYEFARGSMRVAAIMPNRISGHAFRLQVGAHELDATDARELYGWLGIRLEQLLERERGLLPARADQADQDERTA